MKTVLRRFIDVNRAISGWQGAKAERLFGRRCGKQEFLHQTLPSLLQAGQRVLDVGGGKRPAIDLATKQRLNLTVVGLDISAEELQSAPLGHYDETIVGDVTRTAIAGEYDLIFSATLLEHVADTGAAISNLASALKPGGAMAHFVPCRNAAYAVANRWMGNACARRLLYGIYPDTKHRCGFPAYYDRCDPKQFRQMCAAANVEVTTLVPYYFSEYLAFVAPLYSLELLRQLTLCGLGATNLAETFTIIAKRPERAGSPVCRAA